MTSSYYDEPVLRFRWNWGAFSMPLVFGYANHAKLTMLALIPVFNIVWFFICGAFGERWVWNTGRFEDGRTFRQVMISWNRAGKLSVVLSLLTVLAAVGFCFFSGQIKIAL